MGAADVHAVTRQEPVYLSPVTIAEIRFGLELLPMGAARQKAAAAPSQAAATDHPGHRRGIRFACREAEKAGRDPNVRINDLWLAAQAVQRDFRLLTANPKHFRDIQGLRMVALAL